MHIEPWWMFIPFALVLCPPLGVLLAALALVRATSGLGGLGDRKMARRIAKFDRERARR